MQQLQRIADHFNVPVTQLFPIAETDLISPEVNASEIDWKQRALVSERKLAAVQEALALILKGTQKLQQTMR